MNGKFLELYNYATFALGVFITLMGLFNGTWILIGLGCTITLLALGTVVHLVTGKHNKFSKLPKDFKVERQ